RPRARQRARQGGDRGEPRRPFVLAETRHRIRPYRLRPALRRLLRRCLMALNDPNLGLAYGWAQGEHNWNGGMDANLKRLGAVVGLSVKDRDLATPPATPVDGDRYIVPAAATGAWAGRTDQIAVR